MATSGVAAQHRIFMANDPPRELQGLVAVVGFRGADCPFEDFAGERRCCRDLEGRNQFASGFQSADTFVLGTDIGATAARNRSAGPGCRPDQAA